MKKSTITSTASRLLINPRAVRRVGGTARCWYPPIHRWHVALVALTQDRRPPKTVNHSEPITVGMIRTAPTNSRIVRPREIRAMNIPTKGAQLIHQPQ